MLRAFARIEPSHCRKCRARINEIYGGADEGGMWLGCHHSADGYTIVLHDGSTYVIAAEINLSHSSGSAPISTFNGDRNG